MVKLLNGEKRRVSTADRRRWTQMDADKTEFESLYRWRLSRGIGRGDDVFGFPGLEVVVGGHDLAAAAHHTVNAGWPSVWCQPGLSLANDSDGIPRNAVQL